VEDLAGALLRLSREDLCVLRAIEAGMRHHQWVPLPEIARISGLPLGKAERGLGLIMKLKLASREEVPYEGYQISFDAYDLLALAELADRGAVSALGERIGVGKESVVYEAMGDSPLIIKFHREGRTSFKHVRRARGHLKDRPRVSWLYASRLAARHEFRVMTGLYPAVSIPRPVAQSRHALAMELVCGRQLNKVTLKNPKDCLEMILEEVGKAHRLGVIHADLSEYNVLVGDGIWIIDWPQAVGTGHPHASELFRRDLSNILSFFARRYRLELPLEDAMAWAFVEKEVPA
jgi:RIO kinase 2